jgi:hypothetical protein
MVKYLTTSQLTTIHQKLFTPSSLDVVFFNCYTMALGERGLTIMTTMAFITMNILTVVLGGLYFHRRNTFPISARSLWLIAIEILSFCVSSNDTLMIQVFEFGNYMTCGA